MARTRIKIGQNLEFLNCDENNKKQRFIYNNATGYIQPFEYQNYCVTARESNRKEGEVKNKKVKIDLCEDVSVFNEWNWDYNNSKIKLRNTGGCLTYYGTDDGSFVYVF